MKRLLARGAATLGAALVFCVGLVLAVLAHLDLPVARRLAVSQVDALLVPTFKGKLELLGIDRLRLTGIDGLQVRIVDPDGVTVILAQGVSARLSPWSIVRSAVVGKGEIDLTLSKVKVDHVDVNLDLAPDGALRLLHAMEPRVVKPSAAAAAGRGVRLALPDLEVSHSWVHGPVAGTPLLDVETLAFRGAVFFRNKQVQVDVSHVAFAARGLPQGLNPAGEVEAHLKVPSKTGKDVGVEASFAGVLGTIPVRLKGEIDGRQMEATVDVDTVDAERIRGLVPQAPVFEPVSVHLTASGELPQIAANLHLTVGRGQVDVDAKGLLSDDAPSGEVTLKASHLDARALSIMAPRSDLGGVLTTRFAGKPGTPLRGDFSVDVTRGSIGEQIVPHTTAHGSFEVDPRALGGAKTLRLEGHVAEDGAPLDFSVDLRPDLPSRAGALREIAAFHATSNVPSLPYVRRLSSLPKGHGRLALNGTVTFPEETIDAAATAEVDDVESGDATVEGVRLALHATGTLRAPLVESKLTILGARASALAFSSAEATASGPLSDQKVDLVAKGQNSPDVELHAEVDTRAGLSAKDLVLVAKRDGIVLRAKADAVRRSGGELTADGVVVEGLGNPAWGRITLTPSAVAVRGGCKGLDVDRIARLLGLALFVHGGEASFDVDFDARKDGATGRLALDVSHLSVVDVDEVSAHVQAKMEGRRITGTARAAIDKVGVVDVKDSVLDVGGGGPLDANSWRRAFGQLALSGTIDLAKLEELLPKRLLPVSKMAGQVYFEATTARDSESDFTPALFLSARTHGLSLTGQCPPRSIFGPKEPPCVPWRSEGVDLQIDSDIDGESGFAELALRAADKAGVFVAVDAKSADLPYASLLVSSYPLRDLLEETAFVASVVVPRRSVSALPELLPKTGLVGDVEATMDVTGSLLVPRVALAVKATGLRAVDAPAAVAMNASVSAEYDGTAGSAAVALQTAKEQVLALEAKATLPFVALLHDLPLLWTASAKAHATRFPLAAFPELQDHNVRGHVSGDLAVSDLHKDASASLDARVDDLQVGPEVYEGGHLQASLKDGALAGTLRVEQPSGSIDLVARSAIDWGAKIAPSIDEAKPVFASVDARRFQMRALRPLAARSLSELDGTLEGQASIEVTPKTNGLKMQGALTLDDGVVQLSSTGQEFHKAHAKLSLLPGGIVRLDDVNALGLSGKLMASGVLRMNGSHLGEARLDLRIPKGHPIPLDVDGAEMGDIDGDVSVVAKSPRPSVVQVDVAIPRLHATLPVATRHNVASLDATPGVHVGVYKGDRATPVAMGPPRESEDADESGSELDVAIHLGKDVEVRRGTQLKVDLGGDPVVKIGREARVTGQVFLKSGTLEVQGKRFDIEKGTVTFVGDDPTNPEAVVTAAWTAPDGTRIYADFIGPLKTGKVTLRAEPTLPNNEILALILFGTADGGTSTAPSAQSAGGAGAAAASGFATQGLSQGLDELTGIEVSGRLDNSDAANPRPEVEVQIARDISLQIAFVLGTPPPGQNSDRTFATLAWRFFRNWNLATTFGDAGSSIADVVWQYRY